MVNSHWLSGHVRHRRRLPVRQAFEYPTGMLAIDLDEWDTLGKLSPWLSVERFNVLSLYRADYFRADQGDLRSAVRQHVHQATGWMPDGRIELIAHPRYLGHCFNPVAFYLCYASGDDPLDGAVPRAILAEITNTPWHERHTYCLCGDQITAGGQGWKTQSFDFQKNFHVSPFNSLDQTYRWHFSFRPGEMRVHMNVYASTPSQGPKHFDATLVVQRTPLDRRTLHKAIRRFPAETLKVVAGIYWQALRLKLKGAPVYDHPRTPGGTRSDSDGVDVTLLTPTGEAGIDVNKVTSWKT